MKCILSRKTREIQWKRYFSSFRYFSLGFECVLVQMLLIQTLLSVLFYNRKKVILSSFRWYDYFVCRVKRFRVMVDFDRDPDKFRILWITVSCSACSAFDGGFFVCLNAVKPARCKRHVYIKVCTTSFERPVNYLCNAWHVFSPKYEAWTHFNRPWTEY